MDDDDDLSRQLDGFLAEVLGAGRVPQLPTFLGEDWEPVAEVIADLLGRFQHTMVVEVTRPDGSEFYVQFARETPDVRAELVSNEFLGSKQLPADRVSLLLELGWRPPGETSRNFSRVFVDPDLHQLAWVVLQTLHDVYEVEPKDTWSVIPAELADGEPLYGDDDGSAPTLELSELTFLEEGSPEIEAEPEATREEAQSAGDPSLAVRPAASAGFAAAQLRTAFQMPKAVTISGRSSSVTNSFVNSIIPVITPTADEIKQALEILGMSNDVTCSYCGDPWTEWDHLRPIVVDRTPTGYISEIHNLVPACGKCNQSKGNRPWRVWMFGNAPKSPKTRGIHDLEERAARLDAYEQWKLPTKLDFAAITGAGDWQSYWERWKALLGQMRAATDHATRIRALVAASYADTDSVATATPPVEGASATADDNEVKRANGWTVVGPEGTVGPVPKNRAVLEAVRGYISAGGSPESILPLLGPSHFRSVTGTLSGEDLWQTFAESTGKSAKHRRLWFIEAPIHTAGNTWVLANNVWGPRTYLLFKDLVTWSGGAITIVQPNGFKVKRHDTAEGLRVLKPGEPIPPKHKRPEREQGDEAPDAPNQSQIPGETETQGGSSSIEWSQEEVHILDRLASTDPRWRELPRPTDGFGSRTLRIAADLTERGFHVRPLQDQDMHDEALVDLAPAQLVASNGVREIFASTSDYGQRDPGTWARLKQRIGPYPESSAVDRALADFSVHGPFERHVIRRDQQIWVTVMVRLRDLATAMLDLENVAAALNASLRSVGGAS